MQNPPAPSPYAHARATILAVLVFALIGSVLGVTVGVWQGAVSGPELWLIVSCFVFSLSLMLVLLSRPFDRLGWVAPVAGSYFLLYLCLGAVMSISFGSNEDNLAVYLFWFFPLYAFNKFVNVHRLQRVFSAAILVAPMLIITAILLFASPPAEDRPILVVYCVSYASLALVLRLFAQYREAFVVERERAQALEDTEQALRASEERFRNIAMATADTVWDWDIANQRVWWSEGVGALYGYEPKTFEPGQDSWTSRIHPEDRPRVVGSIGACTAGTDEAWRADYRFMRADGSYADVADRAFVIRDAAGKAIRMVGGMTDVSDMKLLESRLRQVQRLEAIGQLTGGIAHDFNNLLTVIIGNTEMLADSLAGDAELAGLAAVAGAAADRGADLTRRVLAFARQQPLEPRARDLNAIIRGMDGLLRRTLSGDMEIEIIQRPGLWPAFVDAGQLENAILNLAINARDAMPGGGKLTIETNNVELDEDYVRANGDVTAGPYVMVAVSDTGTGMTPEVLARVFEPFFTTKGLGTGSGLGLSMVFGYVKQSNGHIKIYSEPGQGTTVRLYMPRAMEATEMEPLAAAPQIEGGSESILLVEDDPMVRDVVEVQLRALGYAVTCVGNGTDALAALRASQNFDLLFTDVVMPGGVNGRQLADAAAELQPDLPVLFTSGYTENAIVHHGRLDRGVHLLNKPYSRAALAAKVRAALEDRRPGI